MIVPGSFLLSAYDPDNGERIWWVGGLSFEMKSTPGRERRRRLHQRLRIAGEQSRAARSR